jgi:septum site-determining protein MinD
MAASHIIAIVGGKGGVGKSTFAANFAIASAIDTKGKVLLVDHDPRACGDIGMLLGAKPKRTVLELGQHEGRIDANGMMSYVAQHPSGIYYLPSVLEPEQLLALTPETTGKALTHAKNFFNTIIVDLGSDLDACGVKTLELSTAIFVVTMPEILVLHHTRKVIERIQNLLFPMEMIKVVLNRFTPRNGIAPQMVQNNLKKQVLAVLPEDEATAIHKTCSFPWK